MDFVLKIFLARYPLPRFIKLDFQYIVIAIMIYNFTKAK